MTMLRIFAVVLLSVFFAERASAVITVSIDLDRLDGENDIDDTLSVNVGDTINARVVLDIVNTDVSAYGVSVQMDGALFDFTDPASQAPLVNTPLAPAFGNPPILGSPLFEPEVQSNTAFGEFTVERSFLQIGAFTQADPFVSNASGTIAEINFVATAETAANPVSNVRVGILNAVQTDGFLDGNNVLITDGALLFFNPGTVNVTAVPEPSSFALLGMGLLAAGYGYRRKSKRSLKEDVAVADRH